MPIIRLAGTDREPLATHLRALGAEDRRLRFGSSIGDAGIEAYVARIDFERDPLFAMRDFTGRILAAIHAPVTGEEAELGLSVLERFRGLGLGNALISRAVIHLRNRGVRSVFVHYLAENDAMIHLARKHGMRADREGSSNDARLVLEPASVQTFFQEWLGETYAIGSESLGKGTARFSRAVLGVTF